MSIDPPLKIDEINKIENQRVFGAILNYLDRFNPFTMAEDKSQQWFAAHDCCTVFGPKLIQDKNKRIAELEQKLAKAKERALEAERMIQTKWIQNIEAARQSGFEEMRQAAIEIMEVELPHRIDYETKSIIVAQCKHVAMKTQDDFRNAAIAKAINVKRWRHKKRGSTYTEIGRGKLQTSRDLVDCDSMVIYKGDDGQFWVRPESEFDDGRFEPVKLETKK